MFTCKTVDFCCCVGNSTLNSTEKKKNFSLEKWSEYVRIAKECILLRKSVHVVLSKIGRKNKRMDFVLVFLTEKNAQYARVCMLHIKNNERIK